MGLEEKIRRVCDAAEADGRRRLTRSINSVSGLVARVLANEEWHELPAVRARELDVAYRELREAARIASAAEYVRDRVLNASNGRVVDRKLHSDLAIVQRQIYELFDTGEAPRRGFVYVAWSQRPEVFWYVGKAAGTERMNLPRHGNLAHAAAHATQLSLLFPTQSTDDILLKTEASVLALVEHSTGSLPRNNAKRERVPEGGAEKDLERLTSFMEDVAIRIAGL